MYITAQGPPVSEMTYTMSSGTLNSTYYTIPYCKQFNILITMMVVVVVVVVRLDVCMCQPGDRCMVVPSLSADEAKKEFSDVEVVSVPSGKAYLRFTSNY